MRFLSTYMVNERSVALFHYILGISQWRQLGPLIVAWINFKASMDKKVHLKYVWNAITYLFPNLNCATVEVWERICNFIPNFTGHVITYPFWDWSSSMLVKGALGHSGDSGSSIIEQSFFKHTYRKWQDYVYIQCEYKSTKQKIKHLLREENKVKENKIS